MRRHYISREFLKKESTLAAKIWISRHFQKQNKCQQKQKMLLGVFQKIGLLGCIGYTFKQYLFDIWVLEESSMEPTLKDGQIVVTTHKTSLSRGDIIIVKHPQSPDERVCKRIIG